MVLSAVVWCRMVFLRLPAAAPASAGAAPAKEVPNQRNALCFRYCSLLWSGLVRSGLACSGLVWSGLVWSGLVCSGLVWAGLGWSGLFWSGLGRGLGLDLGLIGTGCGLAAAALDRWPNGLVTCHPPSVCVCVCVRGSCQQTHEYACSVSAANNSRNVRHCFLPTSHFKRVAIDADRRDHRSAARTVNSESMILFLVRTPETPYTHAAYSNTPSPAFEDFGRIAAAPPSRPHRPES